MDPYSHPPFLGPLYIGLEIDWRELTKLSPDREEYSIRSLPLPTHARFAGFSFGERFVAFDQTTPTSWTASISLDHEHIPSATKQPATPPTPKQPATPPTKVPATRVVRAEPAPADGGLDHDTLFTSGVGASNPPATTLPAGTVEAPFYLGKPIGDDTFKLSIDVRGRALPAVVTGTPLTTVTVAGDVTTLVLSTDDAGPVTVGFVPGTYTAAAVLATILAQTNADPAASLNAGNELVLTSGTNGADARLTILGGTALEALGLHRGTVRGTATPAERARVTGMADLAKLTYGPHGALNGRAFTFKTNDRGEFTVTFHAPASYGDVLWEIAAATNTDPAVILDSGQLVFTSGSTGSSAFLQFSGDAVELLGLPSDKIYGTAPTPARVVGAPLVAPHFNFAQLDTLTLTLKTQAGALVKLTFGGFGPTPTANDVLTAITNAIQATQNPDVAASLDSNEQLVIVSQSTGSAATLTVGGSAAQKLGLSPISHGTDATPAVVDSASLTSSDFGSIEGRKLGITTDDRKKMDVSFQHPRSMDDLLTAILGRTNVDPVARLNRQNQLVLESESDGANASVTIVGGGSALGTLGLAATTSYGTDATSGPAIATGSVDLTTLDDAAHGGTLNGLDLVFETNDSGPRKVTFAAPASAGDVVSQIQAATNTDPMVVLNASNEIVLTSRSTGSKAYVDVSGLAAPMIGLPTGYAYGTDGGARPAEAIGTQDLTKLTYPITGTLTLATDDRTTFTVTFGAGVTSAEDIVTAIANTDPIVSLSTSGTTTHLLVLTSANVGSPASITIIDGTALVTLGLTPGPTYGTGLPSSSSATPATVTGTVDLTTLAYGEQKGALNGQSLTFTADGRAPFTLRFGTGKRAPTSAGDVVAAVIAATNVDPVASVDGNGHLVLRSKSKGSSASLTIGGTAVGTLGLPLPTEPATTVTLSGTAAPGLSAATSGRIDARLFYFVERR